MATLLGRASSKCALVKSAPAPCLRSSGLAPRRTVLIPRHDAVQQPKQLRARVRSTTNEAATTVPLPAEAYKSADSAAGSIDGGLLELTKDTFWEYLKQQGDTLVVVDFYTDWCGPCKLIYPELVKLSHERTDVRFVKVNCNKSNKELGMGLGIKVAPTFQLYRNSVKVAEMTGAKIDKLTALVDEHQPPATN
ncbi:hypothetical protein Agub_g5983 [Astrephomene gubernaculifera]|uniref:Thioredoxin domain-containing protein n=1 Tax=Astrephomene gubernaculifera TaxID=47775 RepID=A0AAD3DRP4_9CHLO|nr:hypothetical protein Agub_g5983 [Astrephomene gubernaculifera]